MKSIKNLLIPFIILIALVIGVVIYYAVNNVQIDKIPETFAGAVDVVYLNTSDISSITVMNHTDNHKIVVNCLANADGSITYEYSGDDVASDEKYSQAALYDLVYQMSYFQGYLKVSSDGNFAEYGLDNPRVTVSINTTNGSDKTVYLGNSSPDGQFCYMNLAGTPDVYTVSASKVYLADKTFLDFLESIAVAIDLNDLKSVHFERKTDNLTLDAVPVVDNSGYVSFEFTKPYHHGSSVYFYNLVKYITNLQITEYVSIPNEDLAKFGLDKPVFHFILTENSGNKTELYISQKVNGYYYGFINGKDRYFKIADYQIDGLELQELVLINPNICTIRAADYSTIEGRYGDKSFKLDLDIPNGKSITDEDASVSLDGRNADVYDSQGRSYCSVLFETISGIKIGGVEFKSNIDTSAGPVLSFIFIDKSYKTLTYDFYTRDGDSFYAYKDGEYMGFYVYSKEFFNNSGNDTYNYGCWSAYELLSEAITNNINGIYNLPA